MFHKHIYSSFTLIGFPTSVNRFYYLMVQASHRKVTISPVLTDPFSRQWLKGAYL